jgi:hypothetical protein
MFFSLVKEMAGKRNFRRDQGEVNENKKGVIASVNERTIHLKMV